VGAGLATNGGKSYCDGAFLALFAPDIEQCQVVGRIGAFEEAVCTTSLGVDDTFWDALTIEMGKEVD
jgi:hypothetical protein